MKREFSTFGEDKFLRTIMIGHTGFGVSLRVSVCVCVYPICPKHFAKVFALSLTQSSTIQWGRYNSNHHYVIKETKA